MTVKELIEMLQKVEDKNMKVGITSFGTDKWGYADFENFWIDEITGCDIENQEDEYYLVLNQRIG